MTIDRTDYNTLRVIAGDIEAPMLKLMVEAIQKELGISVDGRCGPMTMNALRMHLARQSQGDQSLTMGQRALAIAIRDIGKGEDPGTNNLGAGVTELRQRAGLPDSTGPWCAVACSAWLVEAGFPYELVSANAYNLFSNALKVPSARLVQTPESGAIGCWKRRNALGLPTGHHVNLTELYRPEIGLLQTLDGNHNLAGKNFALVDRFSHPQESWKKDLVGFVVLP